jgi:hypothetical protein
MEIGSPMASMYLLQNPDHYTSHNFILFWWKSFMNDVTGSQSLNRNVVENDNIDVKMENEEEKANLPFLKNSEIKVECLGTKIKPTLSERQVHGEDLLNHVDVDSNLDGNMEVDIDEIEDALSETQPHGRHLLELDKVVSHLNNMEMDVDSLSSIVGGGLSAVQKAKAAHDESLFNRIECDDEIEDRDEDESENEGGGGKKDEDKDDFEIEGDPSDEKLLISQDGNDCVASSKVDDYKYRPEIYASSSLYDWTKLYVKVKRTQKSKDKTCFQFLSGHGQRNTHVVKLIPSRSETHLLNFIGGPLPRCDQGDFEYYCSTMLTLFKPWRKSQDLKDMQQTWAEAFESHSFKPEHKKIMNNFNLRYECLDERDDYHAILKRQSKMKEAKISPTFQDQHDNDNELGINSNFEEDYGDQNLLGPNAIKKAQQMIEAEMMMKDAGWLDDDGVGSFQVYIEIFRPTVHKTGSEWKNVVKICRENLLKLKKKMLHQLHM